MLSCHGSFLFNRQIWFSFCLPKLLYCLLWKVLTSGGFRDCETRCRKHLQDWKFFLIKINLQVGFRQNSNASKLCSLSSDESFVSFLYINDLYRKKECFSQTGMNVSFLQICALNVLAFKENQVKMKNTGCIHMFPHDIIEINNC